MHDSPAVIESWRREGRAEGLAEGMALGMLEARRADLLRALQMRFQSAPPTDLIAAVRAADDLSRLARWFDAAVTAPTFDVFRAVVAGIDGAGKSSPQTSFPR